MNNTKNNNATATAEELGTQGVNEEAPALQRTAAPREAKSTHSEKPLHTAVAEVTGDDTEPVRALQKTRSSLQSSPRGPRGYLWPIRRALGRSDRTPYMTGRNNNKSN